MSVRDLVRRGVPLPAFETEDDLAAKTILEKIRNFYLKLEKASCEVTDFAEGYFLELLRYYPQSLCSRDMTDSLKLLLAMMYFESKPECHSIKLDDPWPGYSYEDLGLVFDRSKATIHEAIVQKGADAKRILGETELRTRAKKIALEQLIEEEKQRLREKGQRDKETSERTPETPEREDICT
jgi:hypothetical protein